METLIPDAMISTELQNYFELQNLQYNAVLEYQQRLRQ